LDTWKDYDYDVLQWRYSRWKLTDEDLVGWYQGGYEKWICDKWQILNK